MWVTGKNVRSVVNTCHSERFRGEFSRKGAIYKCPVSHFFNVNCNYYCILEDDMYVINKGNRYGGLQLSPVDVSLVMCYCGLTVGKYGTSRRCTVRCPGSDVDTQVCGNILVNSVIYVYRGRSTRSTSIHSNTLSRSYLR